MRFKFIYLLLILFVCSVIIRLPNLNRPISKHHEFNTAFFLIPMKIWESDGLIKHGFLPAFNYPNPNDKNIDVTIGIPYGEKDGTSYYLSMPSFSHLLPYIIFKTFNAPINQLSLQIFNLCLHLVIILALFLLLRMSFDDKSAFIGSLIFIFSPVDLWFYGNGYTHHVLALSLVVFCLYFLFSYLKSNRGILLFLFGISFCLLLLTEWISVFLGAAIFVVCLINFKSKEFKKILPVLFLSVIPSLVVFYFQYFVFIGGENYLHYLGNRFAFRSTLVNHSVGFFETFFAWIRWLVVGFGSWLLVVAIFFWFVIQKKIKFNFTKSGKLLFFLFLVPVLLYHLLLMEFTYVHDYSVLYDSLAWCFLLALFVFLLKENGQFKNHLIFFILSGSLILSVAQYYFINRPGKINQNGDPYDMFQKIGEEIKRTARDDETVFMTGFDNVSVGANNTQILYYAGRNIEPVHSEVEALKFMKEFHRKKGILYTLKGRKVKEIRKLEIAE